MPRLYRYRVLALQVCVLVSTLCISAQEPDTSDFHLAAVQARSAPAWLQPGLIYEVFPHDFSPEGNLNGVTAGLDRLKALGVTVVWLMPIHPSGTLKRIGTNGSPYAVRDFYAIEPSYGTKQDLHRLVEEAHRRGMKVILDMVADHTAFDSVMLAHPEFYKHDGAGQLISPHGWHDVAALDYANPALRRYMIDMFLYWVRDFKVDGFRCDAAGEVPTDFWEQARAALDQANPNLLMLAEASKPELERKAFSLDYDWPLLFKLDEVIMKGVPASELRATVENQESRFPKGSLHMLISDDHDTERAVVRYGNPAAIAASALMFTFEGVPLLYNGMEVGDATPSAGPALFESLKIYWQGSAIHPEFQKFYSFMIPFRAQHPALSQGALAWVHNSDEQHVLSYLRASGSEEFLVVINLSNTPFRGTVEAGTGTWQEVKEPLFHDAQAALPSVSLDAFGFRMFEKKP
jgi:cyclomaltodextrinase